MKKVRLLVIFLQVFLCTSMVFAIGWKDYQRISYDLSKIRKLKFKRKVPYVVKSKGFIRKFLKRAFQKELPPKKLHQLNVSLKVFGFIPEKFDTKKFLIDLYTEQVVGVYDHESKKMILVKGGAKFSGMEEEMETLKEFGISMEDVFLLHEMEHALQDQYFNLTSIINRAEKSNNDDYENAVQSVIEGDATVVMMYYMFDKISETMGGAPLSEMMDMSVMKDTMMDSPMYASQKQFAKAPLYFKRVLLFPYIYGMVFVDYLKKKGGWALVNKAFRNLPKSTEQIIHPHRYIMKDNPVLIRWVKLPKKMGPWYVVTQNVAGELTLRILFQKFLPDCDFNLPSEGWGGDVYRIYESKKGRILVWYTTWDRTQDAREFLSYYVDLLKRKYPHLKMVQEIPDKAYLAKKDGLYHYVAINGKDVLVIEKAPKNLIQTLIKKGWFVSKKVWK